MSQPASVALTFAGWATALKASEIPEDVRASIGLRVADAIGLTAAAWNTRAGVAVRRVAEDLGGTGSRLLFDERPLGQAAVAFAHGSLIHSLDYDDTFPTSVIHPTSVLFAAASAVAREDTAGDRLLVALAAGDEFLARAGAEAGRGLHARGFQATSVFGPLAAALVVGVLLEREPDVIASAMGLSGSMSGGLLEFLSDGTWSKRLHPGWAAHGGVVADALSVAGFPGPASVVEGRHGLFASFLSRGVDAATLTADLGTTWVAQEAQLKLYPCAHVIHPFLELGLSARAEGIAVDDIAEVVCGVAPWYVPIVCEPRAEKLDPTGEYQARTSLPLSVALALIDGRVDDLSYADESIRRPEVRELARRITHIEDADLDAGFGARMHIIDRDGRSTEPRPAALPSPQIRARAKFDMCLSRLSTTSSPDESDVDRLWRSAREVGSGVWGDLIRAATAVMPAC
jgi:2-methylcitrate dehydratase PrpD